MYKKSKENQDQSKLDIGKETQEHQKVTNDQFYISSDTTFGIF